MKINKFTYSINECGKLILLESNSTPFRSNGYEQINLVISRELVGTLHNFWTQVLLNIEILLMF